MWIMQLARQNSKFSVYTFCLTGSFDWFPSQLIKPACERLERCVRNRYEAGRCSSLEQTNNVLTVF